MSSFHDVCLLKIALTNECNELSLLKSVLLSLADGIGFHLSIAQVDIWRESSCALVMKMNEWVTT